jgi:hypothetical protein
MTALPKEYHSWSVNGRFSSREFLAGVEGGLGQLGTLLHWDVARGGYARERMLDTTKKNVDAV